MLEFGLVAYVIAAAVVAAVANMRGHWTWGWFFLALLISPLLSLIVLLVMPHNPHGRMRVDIYDGSIRRHPHVRLEAAVNAEDVE